MTQEDERIRIGIRVADNRYNLSVMPQAEQWLRKAANVLDRRAREIAPHLKENPGHDAVVYAAVETLATLYERLEANSAEKAKALLTDLNLKIDQMLV